MLDKERRDFIIGWLNLNRNNVTRKQNVDNNEWLVECGTQTDRLSYVQYMQGKFSFFNYNPMGFAVSDGFTGCVFCKYRKDDGIWYIAHIANDSMYFNELWPLFLNENRVTNCNFYYPNGGNDELNTYAREYRRTLPPNTPIYVSAVGVIDNNHYYSLFCDKVNGNYKVFCQIEWNLPFFQDNLINKQSQTILQQEKYYKNNKCIII